MVYFQVKAQIKAKERRMATIMRWMELSTNTLNITKAASWPHTKHAWDRPLMIESTMGACMQCLVWCCGVCVTCIWSFILSPWNEHKSLVLMKRPETTTMLYKISHLTTSISFFAYIIIMPSSSWSISICSFCMHFTYNVCVVCGGWIGWRGDDAKLGGTNQARPCSCSCSCMRAEGEEVAAGAPTHACTPTMWTSFNPPTVLVQYVRGSLELHLQSSLLLLFPLGVHCRGVTC